MKSNSIGDGHSSFSFMTTSGNEVFELIMQLDGGKKTSGDIPVRLLKENANFYSPILANCFNQAINSGEFPSSLKLADIIPVHKKDETTLKSNYRPISLLPTVSKIFEQIMFSQINDFIQDKFNPLLCGFRKGHSTQHALFNLLQNWQKSLDRGEIVGTLLMDLSKAYDCVPHDLLLAKLNAYGFDFASLTFILSYLTGRKHRVKIGDSYSIWLEIVLGLAQGSILGPLFFNIFINDIFYFIITTMICNFADDNSIYSSGSSLDDVVTKLKFDTGNIINWFRLNSMAANPDKFQVMFLGIEDNNNILFEINGNSITGSNCVKLLGVLIDYKLSFSPHIEAICKQASQKVKALLRIRRYLTVEKASLLFRAYVLSSFYYCPILWMFCSKSSLRLINSVHQRALRTVYYRFDLDLPDLLRLSGSFSIHTRHLQFLLTEVFKSLRRLNPEFMWNCFESKYTPYNLRNCDILKLPTAKTRSYGINSMRFRGSILWNSLPNSLKSCSNLAEFKRRIKTWDGSQCNCLNCRF